MFVRKLLTWILACLLIAGTTAIPVMADGTPVGGGGEIHPWDTNDGGDDDEDGENAALVAARSAIVIVRTGTMGEFALLRISLIPAVTQSLSTKKGKSTALNGAALETMKASR